MGYMTCLLFPLIHCCFLLCVWWLAMCRALVLVCLCPALVPIPYLSTILGAMTL